jgi:hypothetical protein
MEREMKTAGRVVLAVLLVGSALLSACSSPQGGRTSQAQTQTRSDPRPSSLGFGEDDDQPQRWDIAHPGE